MLYLKSWGLEVEPCLGVAGRGFEFDPNKMGVGLLTITSARPCKGAPGMIS